MTDDNASLHSDHQTAWESPGYLIWQLALGWRAMLEEALAPLNLTSTQWTLLLALHWLLESTGSKPTQKELADYAETDTAMTSQVLKNLERRNLIERHPDKIDTRAKRLTITPEGIRLALLGIPKIREVDEHFFKGSNIDDVMVVLRTLASQNQKQQKVKGKPYE